MTPLQRLLSRLMRRRQSSDSSLPKGAISYERARELASHEDPEVRRSLATRRDLRPEILYYLAGDPHPDVRRQIAGNHATPPQADLLLARDEDPQVRGDLAQKIARLAPGLTVDEQDRLRRMTYETLELLARDQITRVRQILAEALKDVAHAPPELIRKLAHDSELVVAGPILEFSPVLTDEDLLEIIHSYPMRGALSAISKRQPVYPDVADAVAKSDDTEAIGILLANESAQIREETLDMLLERAPMHANWHGPLVRRPYLPARAVTRLARFVAESLLQTLLERPELDDSTREAVFAEVRRRVETGGDMVDFKRGENGPPEATQSPAMAKVLRLQADGRLNEQAILTALIDNDIAFIQAAVQIMAGVSAEIVARIIAAKSAKGLISLGWKAGLGASSAAQLQSALGRISPVDALMPTSEGRFPLGEKDMTWQLEFFAALCGEDDSFGGSPAKDPGVSPRRD